MPTTHDKVETAVPAAITPPPPQTVRILIVDDDDLVRRGMATYLSDSGYVVVQADNGISGLEIIRESKPDLVLCDLRMPGMDGLVLLEHAVAECPEMPFVVVTGQGVLHDAIAALRKGAWDFISKPVLEMPVLEHAIQKALEKARLLRENRAYREGLEHTVETTAQQLQANQARLRSVIASFHEAFVLVIGDDDRIMNVLGPAQLAERYGLTREDAKQFDVIQRLEPAMAREVLEAVHDVRNNGTARILEVPIALSTGDFFLELTISPMHDARDRMTAIQVFVRDITRRKVAEAEAVKLEAQLRQSQKLEAIGALAGGIAHDFNNILSVIIGYTHMAIQDSQGNAPVQNALDEVYAAAKRASSLIRQILTFSRRGAAEKVELQIAPVAKEAAKMLRATLSSTIEFDLRIDPNCGAILGDPTQINQIMLNLGVNAYHAMRGNEHGRLGIFLSRTQLAEERHFTTGTLPPGDYILLRVCDTGRGMNAETIEHIFEPFFTTKAPGEGTGMGLSTVHGIVAETQGAIHVESKPRHGTTIDIYFPRLRSHSDSGILPVEEMPAGSGRLLFVDDEEKIVGFAKVFLSRLGYVVTGFNEPLQALQQFRRTPEAFDLVLTDLSMPNLTGLGLAAEIRALRPDIPIVMCTGHEEAPEQTARRASLGIETLLEKPFGTLTLAKAVATALKTD